MFSWKDYKVAKYWSGNIEGWRVEGTIYVLEILLNNIYGISRFYFTREIDKMSQLYHFSLSFQIVKQSTDLLLILQKCCENKFVCHLLVLLLGTTIYSHKVNWTNNKFTYAFTTILPQGIKNCLNIRWSMLVFEDYSLKCEEPFCNCSWVKFNFKFEMLFSLKY